MRKPNNKNNGGGASGGAQQMSFLSIRMRNSRGFNFTCLARSNLIAICTNQLLLKQLNNR